MLRSNSYFKYLNGNYIVSTDKSGSFLSKRCLRQGEEPISEFPDSIDLKITNKCYWGCPYCHESSSPEGASFNLNHTKKILSQLPQNPIEIAIGGGDILEIKDKAIELIDWLKNRGLRPRITLNIRDILHKNEKDITDLLKAIDVFGVSLDQYIDSDGHNSLQFLTNFCFKTIVIHVIAGIIDPQQLLKLIKTEYYSVLILGYKQWGRALNTNIPDLEETKNIIKKVIDNKYDYNCAALGFDNLAIEQLGIKDLISKDLWKKIYLGGEGSHSMYIDAVEEKYAITSRSPERTSWNDIKLLDYYAQISVGKTI